MNSGAPTSRMNFRWLEGETVWTAPLFAGLPSAFECVEVVELMRQGSKGCE